ncbi:hypothetical protein VPH35_091992 [Triticum aestivum]
MALPAASSPLPTPHLAAVVASLARVDLPATRGSQEVTATVAAPPTLATDAPPTPSLTMAAAPAGRPYAPRCQICGKFGPMAKDCWYRYNEDDNSSQDEDKVVAAADGSYGVDTNWYVDSGATNHITNELEKVTMKEKYCGKNQIYTSNSKGMRISHVVHSLFSTPRRKMYLKKILLVPSAVKNLLSFHRIDIDNHVFLEFHPYFFLIKDQATKKILYRGRCVRGLYPLIPERRRFNKQACGFAKLSSTRWHDQLGHAALS